jgi:hypothetical protein
MLDAISQTVQEQSSMCIGLFDIPYRLVPSPLPSLRKSEINCKEFPAW